MSQDSRWTIKFKTDEYAILFDGKEVGWDGPPKWSHEKPSATDLRNQGLMTLNKCMRLHLRVPFDPATHENIWRWFSANGQYL